jgi:hypothetical protein
MTGRDEERRAWRALHSAAAAACPPPQREWVHALFAELPAIGGWWERAGWTAGSGRLVVAAIASRANVLLPRRFRAGVAGAFAASAAFAAGAATGYEGLGVDDDAYLALAGLSVAASMALVAIALVRIYGPAEAAPARD